MAKEIKAGGVYYDVEAKRDKLKRDLQEAEALVKKESASMQNALNKIRANLDTSLMKKKVSELEFMQKQLKAKLEQKIKLNADIGSINKTRAALGKVEQTLDGISTQSVKTGNTSSNVFKTMASKAFVAVGGIYALKKAIDFSNELKNAARDAVETENKFYEVFKGIENQADQATKGLARGYKLAKSTSQELLSSTGDLLVGIGLTRQESLDLSKDIIELSADVASFKNVQGGTEAATLSLTKALLGERESLKTTFKTALLESEVQERAAEIQRQRTDVTEKQAKAMATLAIVQERNKDAIGDFNRTINEQANQERIAHERTKQLTETLGRKLLPIYSSLTGLLINLITPAKSLTELFEEQGDRVKSLDENINPLLSKYDSLIPLAKNNKEKQAELKEVIGRIAELLPTAVTRWNDYGEAIGLSRDKVVELMAAEKNRLEFLNKEAIEDVENQIALAKTQIASLTNQLNQGFEFKIDKASRDLFKDTLSPDDIREKQKEIQDLNKELSGMEAQLKSLKGESIIDIGSSDDIVSLQAELNKLLDQKKKLGESGSSSLSLDVEVNETGSYQDLIDSTLEPYTVSIDGDTTDLDAKIAAVQAKINALQSSGVDEGFSAAGKTVLEIEKRIESLKLAQGGLVPGTQDYIKNLEDIKRLTDLLKPTDNSDLQKKIFNDLQFASKDYYDNQISLINENVEAFRAAGINEVDVAKWKIDQKRKLDEDYFSWLKEQTGRDVTDIDSKGLDGFKEVYEKRKQILDEDLEYTKEIEQKKLDLSISALDELNLIIADANLGAASFDIMTDGLTDALHEMRIRTAQDASAMTKIFANMANAFIYQVQRMIAQWLTLQLLKAVGIPIPVGHQGGHFRGSSTGVKKMAQGSGVKGFRVPGGHPNDSFPMFVESDEDVFVVPAHKKGQYELVHKMSAQKFATGVGADFTQLNQKVVIPQTTNQTIKTDNLERTLQTLTKRFDILGANLIDLNSSQNKMKFELESKLEGSDIYLSNEKTSKRMGRMR
jgi:hypothetical protein